MSEPSQCPDCGGRLDDGFIPDATYGAIVQSHWHPGPVEKSTFLGMSTGTKVDSSMMIPVRALRCSRCERLFLYA